MTSDSFIPPRTSNASEETQALEVHLAELRSRILWSISALAIGFGMALWASPSIINWMKHLAPQSQYNANLQLVQLTPGEALFASLKLSAYVGLVLSSPVWVYHTVRFILPGLTQTERRPVFSVILGGSLLFLVGAAFSAWAIIPTALGFLLEFSQGVAANFISVDRYVGFCLSLMLLVGLVAEFPLVLVFLARLGIITSAQLATYWREAAVAMLLAGAILTPSQDPLSMLLVAGLLAALYALSWLAIRCMRR